MCFIKHLGTTTVIICTELPTDGVKTTKRYSKLCHQNRWKTSDQEIDHNAQCRKNQDHNG